MCSAIGLRDDHPDGVPSTEGDLRMLTYVLGRDRTVDELGELAAPVGLAVTSVIPVRRRSIIELTHVGRTGLDVHPR